jgi:hypothetical protein
LLKVALKHKKSINQYLLIKQWYWITKITANIIMSFDMKNHISRKMTFDLDFQQFIMHILLLLFFSLILLFNIIIYLFHWFECTNEKWPLDTVYCN